MKNINYIFLVVALTALFIGCATVKVFSPSETSITTRDGFLENETINVSFFDSRNDKSYSVEIKSTIFKHLKNSYPSAKVINDDSKYFKDPNKNEITIKIVIAGYAAGFGVESTSGIGTVNGQTFFFSGVADGRWNGLTGIALSLYDYRNGEEKKWTSNLSEVVSKPNIGGYWTAKNALKESFQNLMNQLCLSIDHRFMK